MLKKKEENKYKDKSQLLVVGSLFIIVGIMVLTGKVLYNYFQKQTEKNLVDKFYEEQKIKKKVVKEELPVESETNVTLQNKDNEYKYIAMLKIPKIGLEKGLVSKDSYYNNVNKNIFILNESDMPDKENGNIILAGHSGNSSISFFKNLYKLSINDDVSIFYNGSEYKYKIVNSYDIEKTGKANIVRNIEKSTLTLITCRQNTNKQIIYICELVEKI